MVATKVYGSVGVWVCWVLSAELQETYFK